MLTEDMKNALAASVANLTWLNTAPSSLDIPDRFIEQLYDDAGCAWYDAWIALGHGEPTDDDYEPDENIRCLDMLLEDAIIEAEKASGKASYADICTLAEQVAAQFTLVTVDGVDEETNAVTWGQIG